MQRREPKKIDALMVLAKASLADRRRRPPWRLLLVALLFLTVAGGFIWWFWPLPPLPPLVLAALDQVAQPDETVHLCARLEPEPGTGTGRPVNLAGCEIYFAPRAPETPTKAATDHEGKASVDLKFANQKSPAVVQVRYPGRDAQRGAQGEVRVFLWPKESDLLVVEADYALTKETNEVPWTSNNLDIHPQPEAVATLQKAAKKFQIVYVTAGADRPILYNKVRAWFRTAGSPQTFPNGPILSRACESAETDGPTFQSSVLSELKQKFRGRAVGIVRWTQDAARFQKAGFQTYLVGERPELPKGVTRVKDWKELGAQLAK